MRGGTRRAERHQTHTKVYISGARRYQTRGGIKRAEDKTRGAAMRFQGPAGCRIDIEIDSTRHADTDRESIYNKRGYQAFRGIRRVEI